MSQRESGFARIERDAYETPEWVTAALIPHIPQNVVSIWEPACGSGKMVRELEKHAFTEHSSLRRWFYENELSGLRIRTVPRPSIMLGSFGIGKTVDHRFSLMARLTEERVTTFLAKLYIWIYFLSTGKVP